MLFETGSDILHYYMKSSLQFSTTFGCRIGVPILIACLLTSCQTPPAPIARVSTQDIVGRVRAQINAMWE